uniref:DUF4211 domain-containing protein n=1 Tax=Romanomermis culicivorax TaxID=13658 RepID=A0A915L5F3_ROMCU
MDTETAKPVNLAPSKSAAYSPPEIKPLKLTIVKSEPLPSAPTPEPLKPKLILRIPKRCLSTENDLSESQTTIVKEDDGEEDFAKVKKHKHRKKKKREKERCEILGNVYVQDAVNDRALMFVGGPSTSSQGGVCTEAELEEDNDNTTTSKRATNDNFSDNKYHQTVVLNKNRKKMRWLQASEDGAFSNSCQLVAKSFTETNSDSHNPKFAEKAPLENFNSNGNKVLDHTPIFSKGAFVVYKSDLSKPDCPIWRVDSQNLLQKFLPTDKDGRTIYIGSSTVIYAGWCLQNQELFAAIQVKNLHQTKQEMTVQLENPITDLFPAISFEIVDGVDRSISSYSIMEDNSSISFELEHPLKEALQTYVHILIVHSILGNYMQVLKLRNGTLMPVSEATLLTKMSEVDNLNYEKKRKLTKDACWSPKFEDALEWYPYCTVNEDDGSGLHCQACGKNIVENVLQLFANEGYDFDTLLPREPKTTVSGSPIPSQDFHVCPSCADIAVLYHKLTHMRYHLYKQCLDKVDLIRGDNTDMEPALIIENCLMQNSWIIGTLQEYVGIWSKIS